MTRHRCAATAGLLLLLPLCLARAGSAVPPTHQSKTEPSEAIPSTISEIRYEGELRLEAHFARPGDVHTYLSQQRFVSDGKARVRLDWTTWAEGDTERVPESFLIVGDAVFNRSRPGAAWQKLSGEKARLARLEALSGLPDDLARVRPVKFLSQPARIDSRDGRITAYVDVYPHVRLGDVRDSVSFSYEGGASWPSALRLAVHERDQQWNLEARQTATRTLEAAAESVFAVPATYDTPATLDDDSLTTPPVLRELAPGLWSAEMEDIGSRSMVVEFTDHLAVIEVAVSSANGERLVDAIHAQWPGKPIRYALFSHYHPHYTGGLRALMAEGATIVTTAGNEAFVRSLADLPFTLQPDRLARSPRPLTIRTFSGRFELADSANDLVAIDYGRRSDHTDEFVVFWSPRAGLLFQTELGWFRRGDTLRASRRARPLLEWLEEQKLPVERIFQSWPMRDTEAELSITRLRQLVAAK